MLLSVSATTERPSAWPALAGGPQFVAIDSNGNLAGKVEDGHSWSYEWNAENQLKRVLKDSVEVARFAYDPDGRRVEEVSGATAVAWAYDRDNIVTQASATTTLRWVHGPGIDEALAVEDGSGQITHRHSDALGSEVKRTDPIGAVASARSYDAFGQLQMGATMAGYAFTGREWDPEIGLYYYRARYYDASVARFTSQDPVGLKAGPNLYAYVLNNPVRFYDPSGLDVYECQRPMQPGGKVTGIQHGLLWSTKCRKSYSFSPSLKGGRINTKDNPGIGPNGKASKPYECHVKNPNDCFESCVCDEIEKAEKHPPTYGPNNTCWDAIEDVTTICRIKCAEPRS